MRKFFYCKLAASNIKRNGKFYLPYLLTCIGTIMMFYNILALSQNSGLQNMPGSSILPFLLLLGSWVVGIFAFIFLFYTNSFLMKRRNKEFGLFNILGMEKRHISKMMLLETFYIAVLSLVIGLLGGILLNKLLFLAMARLLHFEVPLGFELCVPAIVITLILFSIIFLLILLKNLRQVHLSNPITLLKSSDMGEKEPKTKWGLTIIGLLCLGAGYYIALSTKDPLAALLLFFVAVVLVMIGTYCLFTAGSIAILKLLRRNKRFYYQPKHFISISGMIYRMKQNAVGLANICILSTAVLVMVSSTLSLYLGMEDILSTRYPRDILISSKGYEEETITGIQNAVDTVLNSYRLEKENTVSYHYLAFAAAQEGNHFSTQRTGNITNVGVVQELYFIPLEDYNRLEGTDYTLAENEAMIYSNRTDYNYDELSVLGKTFRINKQLTQFTGNGFDAAQMASSHYIIVKDLSIVEELDQLQKQAYANDSSDLRYFFSFDLPCEDELITIIYEDIWQLLHDNNLATTIECRAQAQQDFYALYGGLFFLGIFLGVLFLMAAILIIYYKQISEGYDDKERFAVMQKVGMSHSEVKKTIRSQILTIFFLPLVVACIHICFAFPVITRLLAVLSLVNVKLFLLCTIGGIIIFAILYTIVYLLTAKAYYKIVR